MKITRGIQPKPLKVVVYGPEGIGKSTFASMFPDPLFIDTEGSTARMDVARTETPTSLAMLMQFLTEIRDNPPGCKTLVIDTIDWAERLCITAVCAKNSKTGIEDFGYGKGYSYVYEEMGRILNLLNDIWERGIHIILTAHAAIRKFEQPDEMGAYDRWELKLINSTKCNSCAMVKEWADMVLFANYKTFTVAADKDGKKMSKSLGNVVSPEEIIKKYGADICRLWAGSADYHVDVRCSDAIFKQLSQNYLKFRNTARYCLGNLDGFDPNNLVAPADMLELDRWAVTRLNALIEKCAQAYNDYEFLVVTHAVNDFCVVELSNFYLDIIKDRLYCDETDGLARRSAQTALYLILDTITKIMAPILCFTGDEIWLAMPHKAGDDDRNVLFNDMNGVFADYALSADEMAKWEKIIEVRDAVNGALETARAEKKIGKSLEADVALTVPAEDAFLAEMDGAALADLLIVSKVEVTVGGELAVSVSEAAGTKCPRCWKHSTAADENGLCPRCASVIAKCADFGEV